MKRIGVKHSLLLFLMLLMSIFILNMTLVFHKNINNVYANTGISFDTGWGNPTNGVYTSKIQTSGLSSLGAKSATLKVTVTGTGLLSFKYLNSAGELTITYTEKNKKVVSASGSVTTFVEASVYLTEETNTITIVNRKPGLSSLANSQVKEFTIDRSYTNPFDSGSGTEADPYYITNVNQLQAMSSKLDGYYVLSNDIDCSSFNFKPIGNAGAAFKGTLVGNNKKIINLTVPKTSYAGLFGGTSGATITNLAIDNATINATDYGAILTAYSLNKTQVSNVVLNGSVFATGSNIGGIVGFSEEKDSINVTNAQVSGIIKSESGSNVGGLSGSGGTFNTCTMGAKVSGVFCVGGLTGGYKKADGLGGALGQFTGSTNSSFTKCFVTGEISLTSPHANNYPYWGIINGYGAWYSYDLSNSGQKITVNYTSSVGVSEIKIFNSNSNPNGIVVTPTVNENNSTFTQEVTLTTTYVGTVGNAEALGSETKVNGITGNYGGFTIRFKMNDGTYKYLSTLNRAEGKFQSVFDNLNLDYLTSYVDNFNNIEINTSLASTDENGNTYNTATDDDSNTVSVWGAAKITNANDLEHLSWVINGAIPTTFNNGEYYYNARSIVTLSVDFQNTDKHIDLTSFRYAKFDGTTTTLITENEYNTILNDGDTSNDNSIFVLNTKNKKAEETIITTNENEEEIEEDNKIYEFYGFGKSEMYPYRGSLFGNFSTLTVNMNFPEAYLMGIINCATDQERKVVIENLTINGTICGKYRVGVIAMTDNYQRSSNLVLSNVETTENTTISAVSQVGGLIGQAQSANITISNCTNVATVSASNGVAGGLVGTTAHHSVTSTDLFSTVTIENSTNLGNVSAKTAGGLVGQSAQVNLVGTNANGGLITGTTAHQYVGSFKTGSYDKTSDANATLVTLYTLNLGVANTQFTINGVLYETDENGNVVVEINLNGAEVLTNVTITIENSLTNTAIVHSVDNTDLNGAQVVPVKIVLDANNSSHYETTEDTWKNLKAVVTFSDKSTTNIDITADLSETQKKSNQIIFINATFKNDTYKIPSTEVATLKRITTGVKNYVTSAYNLIDKTIENKDFLTLGTDTKTKYDELITELTAYDNQNQNINRFNDYISNTIQNIKNTNVSYNEISVYFANIVKSVDLSDLDDLSVDYGTFEISKELTFTMLDGTTISKEITYTFVKNYTLTETATTTGVSFTANGETTYLYNENKNVTINKIDIEKIEFENVEVVFDGNLHTTTATLTLLNSTDIVNYTLSYLGENTNSTEPINVDTYVVSITSISGDDAIYYNIPASYTKGEIIINPISVKLNSTTQSFVYNKQSPNIIILLEKMNTSSYTITADDYYLTYNDTTDLPVNYGDYVVKVIFKTNNFVFSGTNEFNVKITQKLVTYAEFNFTHTYNSQAPVLNFFNFNNLEEGDSVEVTSSSILNLDNEVVTKIDAGEYYVQINAINDLSGNSNYKVDNLKLEQKLIVNKANITLKINEENLSSNYGETVNLTDLSYTVTSGTLYDVDKDKIEIIVEDLPSQNAGTYTLTTSCEHNNYNITIEEATYTIKQIDASISFVENDFTYNAQNQYDNLKLISLNNVLEGDKSSFNFMLKKGGDIVTEFIDSGDYEYVLIENETTNNYKIAVKKQDYNIKKYALVLEENSLEVNYNQTIKEEDFSIKPCLLPTNELLTDVVTINYKVFDEKTNEVDYTKNINVGTYTIKAEINDEEFLQNYSYTTKTNNLFIIIRETYLVASNLSKTYDGLPLDFSVELYGEDNEKITNAQISYTLNGSEDFSIVDAGEYEVTAKATAGDNNKECTKTYTLYVLQKSVTLTLLNSSFEYNGQYFIPDFSLNVSNSFNLKESTTYTLKDSEKNILTNGFKDAGNYYVEFSLNNDNFVLTQKEFAVKISEINLTLQIGNITVDYKESFVLQNVPYEVTSEKQVLPNESLILEFSVLNYKEDAGTYTITCENKNPNYIVEFTNGTLQINKRIIKIEETGISSEIKYNPNGYTNLLDFKVSNVVTENAYEKYYLNFKGEKQTPTIAGTYYLKLDVLDTKNYILEDEKTEITKTILISPKTMELSIDISSKTYNAIPVILKSVKCENEEVDTSLYSVKYLNSNNDVVSGVPTEADTYTIEILPTDEHNYKFVNNTKTFTIFTKELVIKEIQSSYNYTRNEIKPTLELLNIENDDINFVNLTYTHEKTTTNTFAEVGSYKIVINGLTGDKSHNYHLKSNETINYQINPTKVEVEVKNKSFTFTNKQIKEEELEISFKGDIKVLKEDYSLSTLPTLANTYTIDITSLNSGIEFDINEFTLYIHKAEITGIILEDKTVKFNNIAHSLKVNTLNLPNGIVLNCVYSENSFVNAGSYEITATLSNDNYETKVLTATLTITQVKETATVSTENEFIYNKMAQGREIVGLDNLWFKDYISYVYVGENYSSTNKPINAGNYKLVIVSTNENNIVIENKENPFEIKTKAVILQNVKSKIVEYSAQNVEYTVSYTGVIKDDDVKVNILYDNSPILPYNAKTYNISFDKLMGNDAKNYHIENNQSTTLTITPISINVTAHDKSITYGESDIPLTYTADSLLAGDTFTGNIEREAGNNVNSYVIKQGSFTAGVNYTINFNTAIYSITQRPIIVKDFDTEFTYNGLEQIPTIEFENILPTDTNVISIKTIGDTVNVGTYKLQLVLHNTNYKLPEVNSYDINIAKKDISNVILSLLITSKDYDGNTFEPFINIDGDYNYKLTYYKNNEEVNVIKNAGVYKVKVDLIDENYKGSKIFDFVVNKINHSQNLLDNVTISISSNSIKVEGLNNINVGVNNNFATSNVIENLTENTIYELFVKILETENYKETIYSLGNVKTSKSALIINEKIAQILTENLTIDKVSEIKEILIDIENLSEIEKEIINNNNVELVKDKLEDYFNEIKQEVQNVKSASDIVDFKNLSAIKTFSYLLSVFGLGLVIIKGKKKNDREN